MVVKNRLMEVISQTPPGSYFVAASGCFRVLFASSMPVGKWMHAV